MRIVLDTNVFVSGVFFSGPPYLILKAWRDDQIELAVSEEILGEYQRVGEALAAKFHGIDLGPVLELVALKAKLFRVQRLPEAVCKDPDDDKFFACAIASKSKLIISGDKHLLAESPFGAIRILKPRQFLDVYLRKTQTI